MQTKHLGEGKMTANDGRYEKKRRTVARGKGLARQLLLSFLMMVGMMVGGITTAEENVSMNRLPRFPYSFSK